MADDEDVGWMKRRGYQETRGVRLGLNEARWNVGHLETSIFGLRLSVAVNPPNDDGWVKWIDIVIPLSVDGDDLVVGEVLSADRPGGR